MTTRADSAVVLIGNELLSGRVRDENLLFLARELWELGAPVRVAWVIRDDLDEISGAVRQLSERHTFVFTTGGIGPTHDDMTIEAIAKGFGVPVVTQPALEKLIRQRIGERANESHFRMARVPRGADLVGGTGGGWPTVRMRNVYVLPGVPSILQRKFWEICERFRQQPLFRRTLALSTTETVIAAALQQVVLRFPSVEIGSYPQSECVLITLEGDDESEVELALRAVNDASPGIPRV